MRGSFSYVSVKGWAGSTHTDGFTVLLNRLLVFFCSEGEVALLLEGLCELHAIDRLYLFDFSDLR